jgi:antitoxin component HigA of HigAB toxin-antitoxin module
MKKSFDIEKLIESGVIENELEYERAMIADRKLHLLSKENAYFKKIRRKLRSLIEIYEKANWSDASKITGRKLAESQKAEKIAEAERVFLEDRKAVIRKKLKSLDLTQEDLANILGHKSKTHMSELVNGIKPFTISDLVAISCLLGIEMNRLVPTFLPYERVIKMQAAIAKLNNVKLLKRFTAAACL